MGLKRPHREIDLESVSYMNELEVVRIGTFHTIDRKKVLDLMKSDKTAWEKGMELFSVLENSWDGDTDEQL